jgi:hypothetical protein
MHAKDLAHPIESLKPVRHQEFVMVILDMKSFYGFHTIEVGLHNYILNLTIPQGTYILMLLGFGIYASSGLRYRVFGLEVSTFIGT